MDGWNVERRTDMLRDYWLTVEVMSRGLGTKKELEEKKGKKCISGAWIVFSQSLGAVWLKVLTPHLRQKENLPFQSP